MPVTDIRRLRERLDAALDADPARHPDRRPVPPDADARERLVAFVALLAKWNRVWNLTAVADPLEMLERHVLDCLTLLPFVDAELRGSDAAAPAPTPANDPSALPDGTPPASGPPAFDLVDVGSGAGLPGLVLAIARPGLSCLSIERTSKKARFQRQAIMELGLERATVRDERVEAVEARARIVASRAFAAPADFLGIAARLVRPGGAALVMLGRAERLAEPLPTGWALERRVRTGDDPERHVALCRAGRIPYDPLP